MAKYLMGCGHVSNATKDSKPICIICRDIHDGAEKVICECIGNTELEGRKAKCFYGDTIVDSRWDLAFFEYRPAHSFDGYYCGCYKWD
jgi:hypothetical protein